VRVDSSDSNAPCASYTRKDSFDDPTGKAQSHTTTVTQCFRIVNGQAVYRKSN
jgi:hypothetical protein